MANEQRFYRHVGTIEDAHQAIKELTDHVYDLRQQVGGHAETISKLQGQSAAPQDNLNTFINGLRIGGVPPQNGQTLKYNSATGQIEWTT